MKISKTMNNIEVQTFICFSLPWLGYFLFLVLVKIIYYTWGNGGFWQQLIQLPQKIWFWCNFLPALFLFGIGLLINLAIMKQKTINPRAMILLVLVMVALDQTIQFFMVTYHESIYLTVIENWLTIIPWSVQSKGDGYISSGQMPLTLHLILLLLALLTLCALYRFLYFIEQKKTHLSVSLVFWIAGFAGSSFNLILYHGGYDYIKIYPLVIFDLKDIYLDFGMYILFQSLLQNAVVLKKIHLKDLAKYSYDEYQAVKQWLSHKKRGGNRSI